MNEQDERELMLKAATKSEIGNVQGAVINKDGEFILIPNVSHVRSSDICFVTPQEVEAFIYSLFEGAPDGAECYVISNKITEMEGWIKFDAGKAYYCMIGDSEWTRGGDLVDEGRLIPRPRKQVLNAGNYPEKLIEEFNNRNSWSGEGFPPVGTVCEVLGALGQYDEWHECEVFAIEFDCVFIKDDETWISRHKNEFKFRPLKTEAEKERDIAIETLSGFMQKNSVRQIKAVASAIYDELGWRPND